MVRCLLRSLVLLTLLAVLGEVAGIQAQLNTAELAGQVRDPKGLGVPGARLTLQNTATGYRLQTTTDSEGRYVFLGLEPGTYQLTVLARGFATLINPRLVLTVGEKAEYNPTLSLAAQAQTVTVTGGTELLEPASTTQQTTIQGRQIAELPINQRDYINFALLSSAIHRDDTPSIGAAPTSGLNFNGQRARSNEVLVDGADAVDASVNGIRSTVSQEAVQEFQVLENGYLPEYGRAMGGVINIVTRTGTNDFHGNFFGYLRHKSIQARNPFSVQVDPTTGQVVGVKQPYTRVQAGATAGGALRHDRLFYFFAYETRRRQESGFSSIGANNFDLISAQLPCLPSPVLVTQQQAAFFQAAIPAAGGCGTAQGMALARAAGIYGAASAVALFGNAPGGPTTFPLPIDCNPSVPGSCGPSNVVPLPKSYVPLHSLIGNYPTREKTDMFSLRLDQVWNANQRSFLRVSVTPSFNSGIQVNAQNQNFGQNAGSRTSLQRFLDHTGVAQHTWTLSPRLLNETRFQFARRGLHYGFSDLPGGSGVAVNIPGYAFFGREPFSTVDRIERRWELADTVTWAPGHHTMKAGVDGNLIQLRSSKPQIFELNFGGVYNFGALDASFLAPGLPAFTAVQAYGLGLPQVFIQGIGQSRQPFDNKTLGAFWQDSWRVKPSLTVNYGVRYDVEFTPLFPPATALNQAASKAFHIVQGIPRDYDNVQPRLGLAWQPGSKTLVRAGFGLFYDHPLLAIAFNSNTADGALSSQLIVPGGTPTGAPVTPATAAATLNAASVFQGVLGGIPTFTAAGTEICGPNAPVTLGYQCDQQRFNPLLQNSLFVNQNFIAQGFPTPILPFTLPVAGDFQYAYAEQGELAVERVLGSNFKLTVAYSFTHGLHLNRPRNINQTDPVLLARNFANAIQAGLNPSSPLSVAVPLASPNSCISTSGASSLSIIAPGVLAAGFATPNCTGQPFGFIGTPAVFNFFRPSGPNPSFAGPNAANYAQLVALAQLAGFPVGPGVPVAWSDISQQESSGNSIYHGLTVQVSKQFARHFQFVSSWTWSHAIDDSTDLQTLLEPQDNRFPQRERGNSLFDQRHRWVTSAIFESPYRWSDRGWWRKLAAHTTVAPIIEVSSGRPFTVLTGTDYNLNFSSNTDRPSVVPPGTPGSVSSPFIHDVAFTLPSVCDPGIPATARTPGGQVVPVRPLGCTGNLGRDAFVRPGYFNVDLRIARRFYFHESANVEVIAESFNLLNRFNVLDVNLLCNPTSAAGCSAGQPSASFDARQFQFALKLNW